MRVVTFPLAIAAFAAATVPASAQEWRFSVTPYLWAAGLDGDVGPFPNLPTADVDMSFSDVMDNLDGAFMFKAEAQRGRLGVLFDMTHVKTESSTDNIRFLDPRYTGAVLKNDLTTATFAGAWRAVDEEGYSIDFLGGVRYTKVSPELSLIFRNTVLLRADPEDSWVDPIIGARAAVQVSPRWTLTAYSDIGGFGASSDFTFKAQVAANFAISDRWAVSAGWRHDAIDYESDGFVYDVVQDGPLVGVTFNW